MYFCQNDPAWQYTQDNPGKVILDYFNDVLAVDPPMIYNGSNGLYRVHCHKLYVWLNRVAEIDDPGTLIIIPGDDPPDYVMDSTGHHGGFAGRLGGLTAEPFYTTFGDTGSGRLSSKPYWFPRCEIGGYAIGESICDVTMADVRQMVRDHGTSPLISDKRYDVLVPVTGKSWWRRIRDPDTGVIRDREELVSAENGEKKVGPVYFNKND